MAKNKVQELRARTGLTQAAFSKKFHIPLRTIQSWEQSISTPVEYVTYMIETILDFEDNKKGEV